MRAATTKFSSFASTLSLSFVLLAAPAFAEDARPADSGSDLSRRVLEALAKSDAKKAEEKKADENLATSAPAPAPAAPAAPAPLNAALPTPPSPTTSANTTPSPVTPPPAPPSASVIAPKPAALSLPEPVRPSVSTAPQSVTPPAPASAPAATYTIAAGDTFGSIAKAKYGNENRWSIIAQANPLVDPVRLKIGQVIKLPDAAEHEKARENNFNSLGKAAAAGASAVPAGSVTVEPGDTLSTISKRVYGESKHWRVIYQANADKIDHADDLEIGMKLTIPPKPQSK